MGQTIRFERLKDLAAARAVWLALAAPAGITDSWDFREIFFAPAPAPLFFYAGYDGDTLIGVLPLQQNTGGQFLEFFGGRFMYNNQVLIRPGYEECIPLFYRQINQPARLDDISAHDGSRIGAPVSYCCYALGLGGFSQPVDFFEKKFTAKSRATLVKKIERVAAHQPVITVNRLEDMDILIELNKRNFGEQSTFFLPHREEIFRALVRGPFNVQLLSFSIGGIVQAVSLAIFYAGVYSYINAGVNWQAVPDLGTYVALRNIEQAITMGATVFDAGAEDFNWKKRLHLEGTPLHHYYTV